MNTSEDLSVLQARLSQAIADCESWRATGLSQRYTEAYDLVEALQLELRRRLQLPFQIP